LVIGAAALLAGLVLACGGTETITKEVVKTVEVPKEVVVVKEVVKTVEVPGETVVKEVVKTVEVPKEVVVEKEVVKTVEVPGETVVKEVVKTVEVPKEVVVEKEVVKTVEVPGETVVKEVVKTVEVVKEVVVVATAVPAVSQPVVPKKVTYPVPGSVLRIASRDVASPGWWIPLSVTGRSWGNHLGVLEHLANYGHDAILSPEIARDWVIDDTGITWTINHGVKWQDPQYGTVDANDIHFTFEQGSREGTESHFVGWYAADFQNQRVIDNNTLRWDWGEGGPTMRYIMSVRDNCCGAGIYSKKYHEDVGEEEFNINTMGSGRYRVVQHTADDIIEAEAVPNHWKQNGEWEIVRALEVPEQLTRVALVRANQADVSDMSMSLLDQVTGDSSLNLVQGSQGESSAVQIVPGGNWQITYWRNSDMPAESPPALENPWVGNPDDPDDLERARNIRRAISFAIDRDTINEEILLGNGCAQYVYLIDECSPFFQQKWKHPYDVEKAKEYMALGGFPDGFQAKVWIPSESPPQAFQEIGEALLPMLNDIGIEVTVDKSSWAARKAEMYREEPLLRDIMFFPWGGNLPLVNFTDYLADLIDGETLWNTGYDHPIGYEIYDNFKAAYADPEAAWASLEQYWHHHSWLEDIPVVSVINWLDPILVGPNIGEVDLVWHTTASVDGFHAKIDE
jgi:ABC-type transport system substrate-binding protein